MSGNRITGVCDACGQQGKLVDHHCHTRDLVFAALKEGLLLLGVEARLLEGIAARAGRYGEEPAVIAVRRFDPVVICENCNHLDTLDLLSVPGPGFSFSLDEMREVRALAGHCENSGPALVKALRRVRQDAWLEFKKTSHLAQAAGHYLALQTWSGPIFKKTVEQVETGLARRGAQLSEQGSRGGPSALDLAA